MKIGIFGGCFNPPHNMHKEIANDLIEQGYLDKVIFVPTGNNYAKAELVSIDQRIEMLNLMIDDEREVVSNISKDLKYQYTFEVLDYFQAKYSTDTIYFICGTDNLNEFEMWRKYEYILDNYKLLVIMRNGDNIDKILAKYSKYTDSICIANISQNGVSSTKIRECVKEKKYDELKLYLNEKVLKYIRDKGLYKN